MSETQSEQQTPNIGESGARASVTGQTGSSDSLRRISGQISGVMSVPLSGVSGVSGVIRQPSGAFGQPDHFENAGLTEALAELSERELSNDYEVGDQIGRGGCAVVYEAWRKTDRLHVVIKVLHSAMVLTEAEAHVSIRRFIREAELISSLNEQHIVKCVAYGCFQGIPCMVLEFVDGLSLDKLLSTYGALPLVFATGIIEQLLSALVETHDKGIIHRDIKPGNIMVFDSPPPYEIRVLDFGISTVLDNLQSQTLMTQQGNVRGTPSYMAPELFTGETRASVESDLYAVGLVYLECLTGKTVFNDENFMRVAYQQVNEPLEVPGFIPERIANIIYKLCAKSAADRYHKASDVLVDIRANIDKALKEEDRCVKAWQKRQHKHKGDTRGGVRLGQRSKNLSTHENLQLQKRRWIGIGAAVAVILLLLSAFLFDLFSGETRRRTSVREPDHKALAEEGTALPQAAERGAQEDAVLTGTPEITEPVDNRQGVSEVSSERSVLAAQPENIPDAEVSETAAPDQAQPEKQAQPKAQVASKKAAETKKASVKKPSQRSGKTSSKKSSGKKKAVKSDSGKKFTDFEFENLPF